MGQGDGVPGGMVTLAGGPRGGGQVGTVKSGRGLCEEVWEDGVEESLKDTEPGEVRRGWLTPRRGTG